MKQYKFFWVLLRLNQLAWITTLVIILLDLLIEKLPSEFWVYQAYALLLLGVFQLLSSFLPFLFKKILAKKQKTRIYVYWIGVLLYFVIWGSIVYSADPRADRTAGVMSRALLIGTSMFLGGYLILCLHLIKKSVKP